MGVCRRVFVTMRDGSSLRIMKLKCLSRCIIVCICVYAEFPKSGPSCHAYLGDVGGS